MSNYVEASQKCMGALWLFREEVNDFLPDTAGGDDYYIDWTLRDCCFIQDCINRAIDAILSTRMRDHVTCELFQIQNTYAAALKEKDIRKCQRTLNDAMREFSMVHAGCLAIRRSFIEVKE